jgi:acetolactate synthase-1/3 small subunit
MLLTLSVYARERLDVLTRVASLFRKYRCNIDSLTVGRSDRPGISRMTIGVDIGEERPGLVEANLSKLVDVTRVEKVNDATAIMRELALIKICIAKDLKVTLPEELINEFHARVAAQGQESLILEAIGTPKQIDTLVEILRPCVIIEMVRTGRVAIAGGLRSMPLRTNAGTV